MSANQSYGVNAGRKKTARPVGYQAYFAGYTQVKVPKKRGHGFRIKRIYTDPYYVLDMEECEWRRRKLCMGILVAVCMICYLCAAFGSTEANAAAYVALFCGFSAFALLFMAAGYIETLFAPRKMTAYTYWSTHKKMIRWPLTAFIFLLITAFMSLVWLLLNECGQWQTVLMDAGVYLMGAAAAGILCHMEINTEYHEEENDTKLPFFPDASF